MKVNIKCKGDNMTTRFENVRIRYVDNGLRFINVIEATGFIRSYMIDDLEILEVE